MILTKLAILRMCEKVKKARDNQAIDIIACIFHGEPLSYYANTICNAHTHAHPFEAQSQSRIHSERRAREKREKINRVHFNGWPIQMHNDQTERTLQRKPNEYM